MGCLVINRPSVSPWSPCSLLSIIFWVSSYVEAAKYDGIVVVGSMMFDGIRLILGFGIMYIRSTGDIEVQKCPCLFKRVPGDRIRISLLSLSQI